VEAVFIPPLFILSCANKADYPVLSGEYLGQNSPGTEGTFFVAGPPMTYDDILSFWTEPQNGYGDVYWIDAKIIDDLKNKFLGRNQ